MLVFGGFFKWDFYLILWSFLLSIGNKFCLDFLCELFLFEHSSALLWLLCICVTKRHRWIYVWDCGIGILGYSIIWSIAWHRLISFRWWAEFISAIFTCLRVKAIWSIWKAIGLGFFIFIKRRYRPFINKLVQQRRALLFSLNILSFISRLFHRIVLIKNALVLEATRWLVWHDHRLGHQTFISLPDAQLVVITCKRQLVVEIRRTVWSANT